MAAQHELHASPETVHWGYFDASLPPALKVDSGDRVTIHAVTAEPDDLPPRGSTSFRSSWRFTPRPSAGSAPIS